METKEIDNQIESAAPAHGEDAERNPDGIYQAITEEEQENE